jgi:penicillin-binding protein 1A
MVMKHGPLAAVRPERLGPSIPGRIGRLFVMPVVIGFAALLVAAGLFPVLGGTGAAVKRFDDKLFAHEKTKVVLPPLPERSTIYAADGTPLSTLFLDQNREIVLLKDVNANTRHAVLAIEDHRFYEHGPVDVSSIVRAAIANLRAGHVVQGGSTISQQLIKNTETGNAETFARKFQEAHDAILLEREYTKDEILELYLNTIYFGNRVYGVGTAAGYYFNKRVQKLTLPQAALLAGLIASPVTYDPILHPEEAKVRRDQVLADMLKYGWIGHGRYDAAVKAPVTLSSKGRTANTVGREPYWVAYVVNEFEHNPAFGKTIEERRRLLFQGGLKIFTTLRPRLQNLARSVMTRHLPRSGPEPPADPQAAVVTVVPRTGAIQAMVGGTNYAKQKVDLASQGARSTGSAFKAFTLAAAMEQGVPPGRVYSSKSPAEIPDCPDNGHPWMPFNAEGAGDQGYINLWQATADSINVVFAQLIADIGPEGVVRTAKAMGLRGYIPPVCSITLGSVAVSPLSMTTAYATLANGGRHCTEYSIGEVVASDGSTIFTHKPHCKQAIPARVAAQVTAMLQGVIDHGTGTAAQIGRPEAGKTGTGQDFQDAWFMGYIPQLSTGVWVGYSKSEIPMRSLRVLGGREAFGGSIAAPIWHDYMVQAVAGLPVEQFPKPSPAKSATVPNVTGMQQKAAEDALTKASFVPIARTVDSAKPAGTIASQNPSGGSRVPLGSAVTIDVSNGKAPKPPPKQKPKLVPIPNVVGETRHQATIDLRAQGFAVSVVYRHIRSTNRNGIVLAQSPTGGTKAPPGSIVTIEVGRFR